MRCCSTANGLGGASSAGSPKGEARGAVRTGVRFSGGAHGSSPQPSKPAAYAGLGLEDGLASLLLRELNEARGAAEDATALPFLAHALQETWARRRGTLLTHAGYQATGGIGTSVARAAERIHGSLDAGGRRELRELCLRMVRVVDRHGKAVRRRVPTGELGDAVLLGRLTEARLVVVDDGEAQLCHDSLLSGWPRLRDWIEEDLDGLLLHRRLGEAAEAWAEAGRSSGGLYRGKLLAAGRSLAEDTGHVLPLRPVERDFLRAGERQAVRRRRVVVTVVSLVAVFALVAGFMALYARSAQTRAEGRETVLIAQQLATQADTMRERDQQSALRLSLAAYRTAHTPETRSSLYAASLTRTPVDITGDTTEPILNIAFGRGGQVLITSQRGGRVQLWDITRPTVPRKAGHLALDSTAAIAVQPRTGLLAAQTKTGLSVWDIADPRNPERLAQRVTPAGTTFTLAFSPDGATLASGSAGGRLRLWDMAVPAAPRLRAERTAAGTDLISLAFNHDGRLLATGNGGKGATPAQVRLWDVRDPAEPLLRSTGTAASVMAVAFHPRRDLLAATGGGGTLAWWTIEGEHLRPVKAEDYERSWGSGNMPSLSFRADGEELAAAGGTGGLATRKVRESDTELVDETDLTTLPGADPVQAVAYSPDGAMVAGGDVRGALHLWPQRPPAPSVEGTLAYADPGTSAVSADGRLIITTADSEESRRTTTSRVWDIGEGNKPRLAFTVPAPWESRFFLPGRSTNVLVAHRWTEGTRDHAFRLWELGSTGGPVPGKEIPFAAGDVITSVSPDGRLLLLGEANSRHVEIWDVTDIHAPVRRGRIDAEVRFGDGSLWFLGARSVATREGPNRTDLRLWDVTDPVHPHKAGLIKDGALAKGAGYIRSSRLLITEVTAENIQLWDLTDLDAPKRRGRLPGAPNGYYALGNGENTLVTVLSDGTAYFWDVKDAQHPRRLQDRTMRFDRPIESVVLSPDGDQVVTRSPLRIWDVAPDGEWLTPSVVTIDAARSVELLPGKSPFMVVATEVTYGTGQSLTYLLDTDADRIYEELCRTHPLSVDRKQWDSLFPHLGFRSSCG